METRSCCCARPAKPTLAIWSEAASAQTNATCGTRMEDMMTRHCLMSRFAHPALHLVAIVAAFTGSTFASTSAQAACEWNLNGLWNFYQDNGVTLTFRMTHGEPPDR